MCYAVVGGMVLVSNSELYVEDAVNQLSNPGEDEKDGAPRFKNVNRYFSAGAGLNVFLNTTCFSDLLPLLLRRILLLNRRYCQVVQVGSVRW